jgi:hypothetical protein
MRDVRSEASCCSPSIALESNSEAPYGSDWSRSDLGLGMDKLEVGRAERSIFSDRLLICRPTAHSRSKEHLFQFMGHMGTLSGLHGGHDQGSGEWTGGGVSEAPPANGTTGPPLVAPRAHPRAPSKPTDVNLIEPF